MANRRRLPSQLSEKIVAHRATTTAPRMTLATGGGRTIRMVRERSPVGQGKGGHGHLRPRAAPKEPNTAHTRASRVPHAPRHDDSAVPRGFASGGRSNGNGCSSFSCSTRILKGCGCSTGSCAARACAMPACVMCACAIRPLPGAHATQPCPACDGARRRRGRRRLQR